MNPYRRGPAADELILPKLPPDPAFRIFMGVLLLIGLGCGALVYSAVRRADIEYAEYMRGCEQDHKHYECMLLWRGSRKNDDPLVVPVPVVIPGSR